MLSILPLPLFCIASFRGVHWFFLKGAQVANPDSFQEEKVKHSRGDTVLILHRDTFGTSHLDWYMPLSAIHSAR